MKQFAIIQLLFLQLLLLFSCHSSDTTEGKAITENTAGTTVIVTPVKESLEPQQIQLSGSTEAETSVDLGFMVSGKVNQVTVQEGEQVKVGQLIASLDPTDYSIGVDIANANLSRIEDEYNRLTILNERGSITPADYKKAETALQEVRARQKLAAKNLRETRLYAPISGTVARRGTDPGEIISQGMPLFSIVNTQPIKVRAAVPESEVGQVSIGQEAEVYITALDSTFSGTISLIGAVADPASRTYTVKIDLQNQNKVIRPGMVAEASIASETRAPALVVPIAAVQHDTNQQSYVFVVDRQKNQAFRRTVTVGRLIGNNIEIISGLNQNDLVVTGGQQRLTDASHVQIKEIQQP
ncbi:efflux RND transporter periplasmic adaptor subunit [Pontibacter silvestris]|uniref:Efflux RND transporter periplasmic adaptor subunit n=1 Tax=Pontibacter silvestris TaxID=2305183 RepID=A0ABW4WYF5_9BACT|nr:efflux RND transporter periplasmic adaptor subunit [Pontibacter silvestris]MCC9138452.1 efflux RND transporter periplasmic adaptor subunit [Pontibacter silvestris]